MPAVIVGSTTEAVAAAMLVTLIEGVGDVTLAVEDAGVTVTEL